VHENAVRGGERVQDRILEEKENGDGERYGHVGSNEDVKRNWYAVGDDGWLPKIMSSNAHSGHLYMRINEIRNFIVHYRRSANGTLTAVERYCDRRRLGHK
jgi:hypothetical protein